MGIGQIQQQMTISQYLNCCVLISGIMLVNIKIVKVMNFFMELIKSDIADDVRDISVTSKGEKIQFMINMQT